MAIFGWLKKTNTGTGTEIEASCSKAPLPALPPMSARPLVSPGSEKFILNCVCALVDRGYQLIFVRQPSGRLRYVESVKLTGDARAGSANARAAASQTIPMADFEEGAWPCAWCGNDDFSNCYCGLVCNGRMVGDLFRCRNSCGKEWVGVPLREVQTSKEQTRPSRPQGSTVTRGPTLPPDIGSRALVLTRK
jgi:hypothetical protein